MRVHQKRLLDKGKIEELVAAIASLHSSNPEVAEKIRLEAAYFNRNADRMRYPEFWTVHGANAILALRCCHLNGRFEDYWEGRRAAWPGGPGRWSG